MKSVINYYYNLNPDKINHVFDYYYFYVDRELYYFRIYNRDIGNVIDIYRFNIEMVSKDIIVSEIIDNRDNNVITYVNDVPYILIRVLVNINKSITLSEISYLANVNNTFYSDSLMRGNWLVLWMKKIDYLEYHHEQNYKYLY